MTSKTIGTTTLASTGGGAVGFFVAQFIVDLFHLSLSDDGQMGLGLLLVAAGSLVGGYLSPSKREELAKVFAEANVPTASEIAVEVASVAPTAIVPSASEVAEAVVSAQVSAQDSAQGNGSVVADDGSPVVDDSVITVSDDSRA